MNQPSDNQLRARLAEARRVVVKVGTRLLVNERGLPDRERIQGLVEQVASLHRRGLEVVLVTSGAIGAGLEALGLERRPTEIAELQMAAAVGQTRLISEYNRLFAERGIVAGQILLTHDDLRRRERHLNAQATLEHLLRRRAVPVVNENDTTSVAEIKVGDNDQLAALVALLIDADLLILLTTAAGLLGPGGRVPHVPRLTDDIRALAVGKGSALSSGGMATKLESAAMVTRVGALAVIADGRGAGVLDQVLAGSDTGTLLGTGDRGAGPRKRKAWLTWFQRPEGVLRIDDGAAGALRHAGRSLLPSGVVAVEGEFEAGAVVQILDPAGRALAQGLTRFSGADIDRIKGCQSKDIGDILGIPDAREVVHRDDLVLLDHES